MGPGRALPIAGSVGRSARVAGAPADLPPMPWTPYADWIFTLGSTATILLVTWLVLRPRA